MNKLLRKLTISVLAVVFAVIAMGATTYAWFTVTGTIDVATVSADVTMDSGIYISADGITWDNQLDQSDLNIAMSGSDILRALTTTNGRTFNEVTQIEAGTNKYLATYGNDIVDDPDITTDDAGLGFKIITFYVRSVNYTTLKLNSAGTSLTGTDITWESPVAFTHGTTSETAGTTLTTNVAHAARFAINSQALDTWTNNALESTYSATYKTTLYENAATTVATGTIENTIGFGLNGTNSGALNYYLTINSLNKTYTTTVNKSGEAAITPPATTVITSAGDETVIELAAGTGNSTGYYYAKVTVTIWLEGWDSECFNSILSIDTNKDKHLNSKVWDETNSQYTSVDSEDVINSLYLTLQFSGK